MSLFLEARLKNGNISRREIMLMLIAITALTRRDMTTFHVIYQELVSMGVTFDDSCQPHIRRRYNLRAVK